MQQVIGQILPLAVGIDISALSIAAVILMLGTPRARSNGLMFLAGWMGGPVCRPTSPRCRSSRRPDSRRRRSWSRCSSSVYFAGGDRAAAVLAGWKQFLVANNPVIMAILLLVFGMVLIGNGIAQI